MGKYYVHKDGVLLRTGDCPDGMEKLQANHGEVVERGEVNTGPQPTPYHRYIIASGAWVDARSQSERDATQWEKVRYQRQKLLVASDWSTLPDVPLTTGQKSQWATYRQALRDVTLQPDPFNIAWPVAPG